MVELDDVLVGDAFVDSYLTQELLLGFGLDQDALADDFGCVLPFGLCVFNQEAECEPACIKDSLPFPSAFFF